MKEAEIMSVWVVSLIRLIMYDFILIMDVQDIDYILHAEDNTLDSSALK